jgi:hypothetical protein
LILAALPFCVVPPIFSGAYLCHADLRSRIFAKVDVGRIAYPTRGVLCGAGILLATVYKDGKFSPIDEQLKVDSLHTPDKCTGVTDKSIGGCVNFFWNVAILQITGGHHLLIFSIPAHHLVGTPAFIGHVHCHDTR